ncbi:MAG: SH3 domain-containing protein [Clostridiales bacterium]|nr:SH3 domain-containing protein [Clostridiales bacterium]
MSNKMLSLLVTLMLLFTFCACAELSDFAPLGTMTVVNCDEWVSLRASPSTQSDRVTKVPLGASVQAYDCRDDRFYYCEYQGARGYILMEYLSAADAPAPAGTEDAAAAATAESAPAVRYAEVWAAAAQDRTILQTINMFDASHARVDMSFKQMNNIPIGGYGQWVMEYSTHEQTEAGFFEALADDAAGSNNTAPDSDARAGDIHLTASELYAWSGIGTTIEFYVFTVDGRQGIFMCWSEPEGGEYSEYASVEQEG